MMESKEKAKDNAKYNINAYCDYIHKLYTAYELYTQAGDSASAQFCLKKILAVEEVIAQVTKSTSTLAYETGNDPSMGQPEEYALLIKHVRLIAE